MISSRKKVFISLLIAQSMVLSLLENIIPVNYILPGVKPGLANIITIIALFFLDTKYVYFIVISRVLLVTLLGGNIIMFFFSLSGGILSTMVMALMIKKFGNIFSPIGVSLAGAFCHNIGQLFTAYLFIGDKSVFLILPLLTVSGLITGTITGYISKQIIMNKDFKSVEI